MIKVMSPGIRNNGAIFARLRSGLPIFGRNLCGVTMTISTFDRITYARPALGCIQAG